MEPNVLITLGGGAGGAKGAVSGLESYLLGISAIVADQRWTTSHHGPLISIEFKTSAGATHSTRHNTPQARYEPRSRANRSAPIK
jgi:hypothetical protein